MVKKLKIELTSDELYAVVRKLANKISKLHLEELKKKRKKIQ